jgi:uncharacterized membrane protein YfcA
MAAANAAGGLVGSHLAIARGSKFVRIVFLVVCSGLCVRLVYDLM